MPYALIIAGIVLTVAGVRNTQGTLFTLLKNDFTGSNSFIWWTISIIGIGAVGYVPDLRKLANAFLALVLIVLLLANRGVFQQFVNALKAPVPNAPVPANTNETTPANPLDAGAKALTSSGIANSILGQTAMGGL